jgi:hypothetical protein
MVAVAKEQRIAMIVYLKFIFNLETFVVDALP